ncbi:conserved hypothetical protein [Nitrosopumilaceae archaeon]|nr:conserved hypothetical protein [Nitrosopumilaceae archaeon]
MGLMRAVPGAIRFIAAGIAAIAVGAFMLRGTMHMWDRDKE